MEVKSSRLFIVFAMLMLSACGNKSEVESSATGTTETSTEQKAPVVTGQAMQQNQVTLQEEPPPAITRAEQTEVMKRPVMASDGTKDKPLSLEEGLALAKKSGCLACHRIETKLVGPAWRDVGQRYKGVAGAKAQLVAKVKDGGKGNWTDVTGGLPMPPNSPRVSDENIEKLVMFVLSL
jgi:cytochrome c